MRIEPRSFADDYGVIIDSDLFPNEALTVSIRSLGKYSESPLEYVHAALAVLLRRYPVEFPSIAIHIKSRIPPSTGLASSASTILASLAAMAKFLDIRISRNELCHLGYEVECDELFTGAGEMDFLSCGLGGLLYLDYSSASPDHRIVLGLPHVSIVVVNSLVRHDTKAIIESIRERLRKGDTAVRRYVDLTSAAVAMMHRMAADKDTDIIQFGKLVYGCHRYMSEYLQISTDLIDACVQECMTQGAYGAKLTGAGMGGCLFSLVEQRLVRQVIDALRQYPVEAFVVGLDYNGVRVVSE